MSFRSTVCLSCRKEIQVPSDLATPACPYCGSAQGPESAPAPTIVTLLGLARTALAAGNSTEAVSYFNRVLESDPLSSEAWIGKGKAAGWQSTLSNSRLPEMLISFNHAIATASDDQKPTTIRLAVDEVNRLSTALYQLARKHCLEFIAIPKSYSHYVTQSLQSIEALEEASRWLPSNRAVLESIVYVCKEVLEGILYRDKYNNNVQKVLSLAPQYETLLQSKFDSTVDRLRRLDLMYQAPAITKAKIKACFVATATMGDIDHLTVDLMRDFRDQWIIRKTWGPRFVELYYEFGPTIATMIENSSALRKAAYLLLTGPVSWFARRVLHP